MKKTKPSSDDHVEKSREVTRDDALKSRDLEVIKLGLKEAQDKAGYWRHKQDEPQLLPETVVYGEDREASATATIELLSGRLESVTASRRKAGKLGFYALKAGREKPRFRSYTSHSTRYSRDCL